MPLAVSAASAPAPAQSFRWRGVLEGFYGRPWTWEQRRRMVDWLPKHHFNLFAIAPKDDPELRERWRAPLSDETRRELRDLAARAERRGVALAWTLSPGLDVKTRDPADVEAAAGKLASVCALGITRFSLAFDDTKTDPGQVDFANAVSARLRERCPRAEMTFVPAVYWSEAAPSAYLDAVARRLDRGMMVAWTGRRIVNRAISAADSERFKDYIRHAIVLGDNYPVQDRVVDRGRLFLGPLTGREPNLARSNEAYLANASPLMDASLIPLATAGDYAWDPAHYDPVVSWRGAIAEFAGRSREKSLALLAGLCARSWLDPPSGAAIETLEASLDRYWRDGNAEALRAILRAMAQVEHDVAGLAPSMARELLPWAARASDYARGALAVLSGRKLSHSNGRMAPPDVVVADQALDRLFVRTLWSWPEGSQPLALSIRRYLAGSGDRVVVRAGLERLASTRGHDEDELMPWEWILSREAEAARDALEGRPWSAWRLKALRWRSRLRFFPLLVSQHLIEGFLARREQAWGLPSVASNLSFPERTWLAWARFARPNLFPSRLARALEDYERSADQAQLNALFLILRVKPYEVWKRPFIIEEAPWLDKLIQYGMAGSSALEQHPPAGWRLTRERLASGNGLELVLELKVALNALAEGRAGDVPFPDDPAAAL